MSVEKTSIQTEADRHKRDVIFKTAQEAFADPNLSEAYKDAVLEVSEQELKKMEPKGDSK